MSVTDNQPTRIGQRVQDIFADSRGWVVGLNFRTDNSTAVVDWDDKPVGDEDRIFPIDALRVVEVIVLDKDVYLDPSLSPLVQQVTHGTEHGAVYTFTDGSVVKGTEYARLYLVELSCTARA